MRTRRESGTWAELGYSREKPGGTAQVLEDRAHPLALPQREAAEDHGNCPTRQLVVPILFESTVHHGAHRRDPPGLKCLLFQPLCWEETLGEVCQFLIWPQVPLFIAK